VVFDLRGADLAAGGQGAPITPLFDWLMLRDSNESVAVVNLGGFCNITLLPGGCGVDGVAGSDVCACNQLLDTTARLVLGMEYDEGGKRAAAGVTDDAARQELMGWLAAQRRGGRSLGTGDELAAWIREQAMRVKKRAVSPNDLARTVAEAVGMTIGNVCRESGVSRVLLAGGGVHHEVLVWAIGATAGVVPELTDGYGVPAAYREAMAIGVLGALCQDRVPITLSRVTKAAGEVGVSGCWVMP
jgi:1,6-anhydro-N-acetylmuramate kinase